MLLSKDIAVMRICPQRRQMTNRTACTRFWQRHEFKVASGTSLSHLKQVDSNLTINGYSTKVNKIEENSSIKEF
uniref:Uncharacterized protein n=1 Tax=Steinernema glaseri TaxID=37863 RepID=A0A1I7ZFX4_9BILA